MYAGTRYIFRCNGLRSSSYAWPLLWVRSPFLPAWSSDFLRESHTQIPAHVRIEQVVQSCRARSFFKANLPRSPRRYCRIVAAFGSTVNCVTSLPVESKTPEEMLA